MRIVAACGAAIAFAAALLVPGAVPAAPRTLIALLDDPAQRALVRVDARTLAPVGNRLSLGVLSGQFVRSPDGSLLAVGSGSGITLIDPAEMRIRRDVRFKPFPNLEILGWPSERQIFAESCCPDGDSVVVVDPSGDQVGAGTKLPPGAAGGAALSDGVAYLVSPPNRIARAQVLLVTPGSASTRYYAPFSRIAAGRHSHKVRGEQVLEIRQPGFAVDPERRIAYVVGSFTLAAELDLRTGAIAYHAVGSASDRSAARADKEASGATFSARWLGNGRIAVAGTRYTRVASRGRSRAKADPAGVALVDTRTWRTQMLDPAAATVVADGKFVLALEPHAVKAFTSDGTLRTAIPINDTVKSAQIFDGLAYVWTQRTVTVVDLDAGAVVATLPAPRLSLIGPS